MAAAPAAPADCSSVRSIWSRCRRRARSVEFGAAVHRAGLERRLAHRRPGRSRLTLGIVASLETLLSLEATDRIDPYKREAPTDRELAAQGVGNIIAGLIGGLPVSGVIVRSAANVDAGAQTKLAAIIHGALLLVAVCTIPALLNQIPLASLAAILIYTGYKLAHPSLIRYTWPQG